ncbi:MAG: response regulator [Deltaproteobacteria bacterium]|nr:MAG: response regulator [Deltaproteobacteria bacterium]
MISFSRAMNYGFVVLSPGEVPAGGPAVAPQRIVLVVEDEGPIRSILSRGLQKGNYTVLTAENGQVALGILKERGNQIGALLTDMDMPVMNGIALITAIRAGQTPEFTGGILAMSGRMGDHQPTLESLGILPQNMLLKPFTLSVILAAVESVFQNP